jgi:hypothetical protein
VLPREASATPAFVLEYVLHQADIPPPTKAPEVNLGALEQAKRRSTPRIVVELASGRARIVLGTPTATGGLPLPPFSELRGRADRTGFVLVTPDDETYRVVPPGALRALLGERRFDVAPLGLAEVTPRGEGARRLGLRTRRIDVTTRPADTTFEIARIADLGDAGAVLCRAIADLAAASPTTPICGADEVPLAAEIRWKSGGALSFEVASLVRKGDVAASALSVPPATLRFTDTPLAEVPGLVLVRPQDIASFRTAPVDVAIDPARAGGPTSAAGAGGPAEEAADVLVLVNPTDQLLVARIDGIPIAWVAPAGRLRVAGFVRGRYTLQWRSALGDRIEPARAVVIPGIYAAGPEDLR